MQKQYCVYIITNKPNGTLYIGVTGDLKRRIFEHKNKIIEGFSKKYGLNLLVYFEIFDKSSEAIGREKYLKGKTRAFKLNLINNFNPQWKDFYDEI